MQVRQHGTVGAHPLDAEDLLARAPEAQMREATGVGGDRAAYRRRVAGRQVDPIAQPGIGRGALQVTERDPGADHDPSIGAIDRVEALEPAQVQDELARQRHRPPDEAGVPTLGHHRRAVVVAEVQHARHLVDRGRAHDRRGCADVTTGPVDDVRTRQLGIGDQVPRTDDVGERAEESLVGQLSWRRPRVAPYTAAAPTTISAAPMPTRKPESLPVTGRLPEPLSPPGAVDDVEALA